VTNHGHRSGQQPELRRWGCPNNAPRSAPVHTFADFVSSWLPLAEGQPGAADGLVWLARCGTLPWQATTGLACAEGVIAVMARSFLRPGWLGEIRTFVQDDAATARWRRIVDGLAAAGDSRAARLQKPKSKGPRLPACRSSDACDATPGRRSTRGPGRSNCRSRPRRLTGIAGRDQTWQTPGPRAARPGQAGRPRRAA